MKICDVVRLARIGLELEESKLADLREECLDLQAYDLLGCFDAVGARYDGYRAELESMKVWLDGHKVGTSDFYIGIQQIAALYE